MTVMSEWVYNVICLTLLQIVYNNNTQISPAKKAPLLKKSEYQCQFKVHKVPEAVSFAPQPSQKMPDHRGRSSSKTQVSAVATA